MRSIRHAIIALTVLTFSIALTACGDGTDGRTSPRTYNTDEYQPNAATISTTTTLYVPPVTTPPTPLTVPRAVVLDEIYSEIPALDVGYDSGVWSLLEVVCTTLDSNGGDFEEVGDDLVVASEGTFDITYGDAGVLAAAAVMGVCPRWQEAAKRFAGID